MFYRSLADFLEELGQAGELARVETEVRASLEAAEIARRMVRSGGSAMLFRGAIGHDMPLATNLFGTEARICRALGAKSVAELADRIASLLTPHRAEGWFERVKTGSDAAALAKIVPRPVKAGAVQQVVRLGSDVDLNALPAIQAAPEESGRTITAAATFCAEPDSHAQLGGRYDLQIRGPDRLAACWAGHDSPARLLAEYGRRGEKMPLAAVLGGDPAILMAAMAPVPAATDVCALAGMFRQQPVDLVRCRTIDLQVPAEAEIVIEGYVDPAAPLIESSPACTPSGYYSPPRPVPLMRVTAVTQRIHPVFPAMIPAPPPNEFCLVHSVLARVFLPLARMTIPELIDYELPILGGARHWATLSIDKSYAGQARRVAGLAWGLPQLMFAKMLVIVDAQVDVHDPQAVLAAIATNVSPGRDTAVQQGLVDPMDIATPTDELSRKMLIDATAKMPSEYNGTWPRRATMDEETEALVEDRWEEYGLGPAE